MKIKTQYICQSCGYNSPKWMGQCPSCGEWHTLVEEVFQKKGQKILSVSPPVLLSDIVREDESRLTTGINEMDRVLGGGIVRGSTILVGGEPGIGKSTLIMQALMSLCRRGLRAIYISGEESVGQIKMRAERLGDIPANLYVSNEIVFENIRELISTLKPDVICIDSIQTIYTSKLESSPGSVSQIRETACEINLCCKELSVPAFVIGHVTKDGLIAGPRVLEHIVDTVLYFEGEGSHAFRIIRAVKNRFGPANELGIFEMTGEGLKEVLNPSSFFIERNNRNYPGSVVFVGIEGTRPILLEIQALVSRSHIAIPRRTATGFDNNRLAMLITVAERNLGITLYDKDIFVNVVGGFKITEPAADLAVVMAIYSSLMEIPVRAETVVFGEIGLTGEIRGVTRAESRIKEAMRIGFNYFIIPDKVTNLEKIKNAGEKAKFYGIVNINEIKDFLDRSKKVS